MNSQGHKAVECAVTLNNGQTGIFAPPAGTSTGKYEAKTVDAGTAKEQILQLKPKLKKINTTDQRTLDEYIKKQKIGANASLAVSVAYAIAAGTLRDKKRLTLNTGSKTQGDSLRKTPCVLRPKLMVLFFEGGVHASSNVKTQEYMGVYEDIFEAAKDYHEIRQKLLDDGHFVNCGMEGGMVSEKLNDERVFELLCNKRLSLKSPKGSTFYGIALDMGGSYLSRKTPDDPLRVTPGVLRSKSPGIYSVEDPFPEDAVGEWRKFYKEHHDKMLIVGDDLTVTNSERIKELANNAVNAVIIKPNQQYTLTDTIEAIKTAREHELKIIISHRSGETNQTFVTDLAVATQADYVKFGAPVRGERVAKYNSLLRKKSLNL